MASGAGEVVTCEGAGGLAAAGAVGVFVGVAGDAGAGLDADLGGWAVGVFADAAGGAALKRRRLSVNALLYMFVGECCAGRDGCGSLHFA